MEELIAKSELTPANIEALAARRPDPMEVSIILATGGTTGLPKAVPRTHNDYIASIEYHTKAWEVTSDDVILTVAPVGHAQAIHNCVGGAFFNYAKYVLTDSTDAADICRIIERERVTAFPTVPTLIQRMISGGFTQVAPPVRLNWSGASMKSSNANSSMPWALLKVLPQ
jgi:non-ribosomal peptide synthetase component E (peptide arylation enzyme)